MKVSFSFTLTCEVELDPADFEDDVKGVPSNAELLKIIEDDINEDWEDLVQNFDLELKRDSVKVEEVKS